MIGRFILMLLIFFVWLVWARYYYVCIVRDRCHGEAQIDPNKKREIPNTLTIRAGDSLLFENYPQCSFDPNSPEPFWDEGHRKLLENLANWLQAHPDTRLRITGRYLPEEQASAQKHGKYENLGIARAMAVADKLSGDYGIAQSRLETAEQQMIQEHLLEPISFEILGLVATNPLGTDTVPVLNAQPIPDTSLTKQMELSMDDVTIFDRSAMFDYGSEKFSPQGDFLVYVDSLQSYLKRNPSYKLVIIGHTDTKGDAKANEKLGKKRAEAVKAYLKKKGFKVDIRTESKGEEEPLVQDQNADKSYSKPLTAQNRRVNIKIEK